MNSLKRIISPVRLVSMAIAGICLLAGCTGGADSPASSEASVPPESYADLSGYMLVRPDVAEKPVIEDAEKLRDALKTVYPEIRLTTDFIPRTDTDPLPTNEILVGETNREESTTLLADLAPRDFAIAFSGERVVIIGGSDEATNAAVEYFIENYIESGTLKLKKGEKYMSRYAYVNPIINGKTVSELTLRSDVHSLAAFAGEFRAILLKETNQTPAASGENAIVFRIDDSLGALEARAAVVNGDLVISAQSAAGLVLVARDFASVLRSEEFGGELSNGWEKIYALKPPHITTLEDVSACRIYAIPNKLSLKKGETVHLQFGIYAGGTPVACDKLTYSVIKDWAPTETKTVSGMDGGFSLAVKCDGIGELAFHVTACDADGNPIKGITKYDESIVVEPDTFDGLFADELRDEAPITLMGETYKMTFLDDFNGTELDIRKWSLCPEQNRHDAGGFWDDSMTMLDGEGNLVLTASVSEDGVPISGAIRSLGKFEQRCGYYECRAKLQHAPGFWGAFWLMNRGMADNTDNNSAKDGVEIDIFESNSPVQGAINQAIHWDGYGANLKSTKTSVKNVGFYDGFHTYGMLWDEDGYTFFIDGKQTWEVKGKVPGSCEIPCYMKLTLEFGSWAGRMDPKQMPDSIYVDYVKVYERVK